MLSFSMGQIETKPQSSEIIYFVVIYGKKNMNVNMFLCKSVLTLMRSDLGPGMVKGTISFGGV